MAASATTASKPIPGLQHHSQKPRSNTTQILAQVQCFERSSYSSSHSQNFVKVRSNRPRTDLLRTRAFADMSWFNLAAEQLPDIIERSNLAAEQLPNIIEKSNWHLDEESTKNLYTFYLCFTIWGCCVFGSMKDPFYDGETYRGDGGDGSQNWMYEKEEQGEALAREELWREELIQEIEEKVGGLSRLEETEKREKEKV